MPSSESNVATETAGSRYEFRIWAASLEEVKARLEKLARPQPAKLTRETYIVSDATDHTNAKIRAGVMDIKILLRTDLNLEQWRPRLNASFPIDTTLITEKIFPALRVDPPKLRPRLFTAEAFVDNVVKSCPHLAAVELDKLRRRYALGECAAEFVEVEIVGSRLHSVAVESAIPRAVLDMVSELQIGSYPNISYVRQIKSALGRG